MRQLQCEFGLLQNPDGSSVFQHGDTKVVCAVYGPAEVKINKEIIDKATIDCILKPKIGLPGVKEKSLEEVLNNTCGQVVLTTYQPRSAIQIVLQVMQDSGSLLSALINGVCMAMVHAGLPMKCMMVAVCCAIKTNGEFIMDPSSKDEKDARCSFTFSFETKSFDLITSYTTGVFNSEEYFRCLQFAQISAKDVASFQRLSVSRYLSKENDVVNDEEDSDVEMEGTDVE